MCLAFALAHIEPAKCQKGCVMRRSLVAFLIANLFAPMAAHAVIYYVRTSGSDANDGRSATRAFRTVQRAMQVAQAGDTVYIGAGTYNEQLTTVRSGANNVANIRFIGDTTGAQTGDRGTPTIMFAGGPILTVNHDWNHFQSIRFDGGTDTIRWNATTGGTLSSLTVRNASDDGVEFGTGARATVSGGTFERAGDANMAVNANAIVTMTGGLIRTTLTAAGPGAVVDGAGASVTFNRVRFLTNNTHGLLVRRGTVRLTNCILADNRQGGIRVEGANTISGGAITTATTVQIVNCTFDENLSSPAVFWRDATGVMINNIFSNHATGVEVASLSTPAANSITNFNNNLYFGNTTNVSGIAHGAADVFVDPGYSNRASNNFTTIASSGGVDRGQAANSFTAVDFSNRPRPGGGVYDIGAYEVAGAVGTVPYFRDMSSALGGEWSDTAITNAGGVVGQYKGPHAPWGTNPQQVTVWIRTTPGVNYSLFFDLIGLNTLDGERGYNCCGPDRFEVLVDGGLEWGESILNWEFGNTNFPAWQSYVDTPELIGSGLTVYRGVEVPFTADNAVTAITFNAASDQGWGDEGFGFDNVRVVTAANAQGFRHNFQETGRVNGFWQDSRGAALSAVDMNADGLQDIVMNGPRPMTLLASTSGVWTVVNGPAASALQSAVLDVNSDHRPDIFQLANDTSTEQFRLGVASSATSLTFYSGAPAGLGITAPSGVDAVAAGDLNFDGIVDLALFGTGGNWISLARPDVPATGSWVTGALPAETVPTFDQSLALAPNGAAAGDGARFASGDVNNDGYIDFFYVLGNGRLFLSNGDGTYSQSNGGILTAGTVLSASFADYDNDGDLDLFTGDNTGAGAPQLWRNDALGVAFTNVAPSVGLTTAIRVTSSTWGDFDNDGDLDLYVVNDAGAQSQLYRNSGAPTFTFTAVEEGINSRTFANDCLFFDADMDGDLDLTVTHTSSAAFYYSRLFINNQNDTGSLTVLFKGRGAGGINTLGIGTRVELRSADGATLLQRRDIGVARGFGQSPLALHFGGVAPATTYTLRFHYPDGYHDVQVTPALANTTIAGTTFVRTYLFDESLLFPKVRVLRWREVSAEGE